MSLEILSVPADVGGPSSIAILDGEIDRCGSVSVLLELKRRRNALLPVARLPPEILSSVFLLCAPPRRFLPEDDTGNSWIAISHVSHLWRTIARDGCAELWTCPPFSCPWMAAQMLALSQGSPLHIRVNFFENTAPGPPDRGQVLAALQRAQLIQTLYIQGMWKFCCAAVFPALRAPAPILESLKLRFQAISGADGHLPFPPLFQGSTPRLERLYLSGCPSPWTSPILHTLTRLQISDCNMNNIPTWRQFLAGLGGMPRLEFLGLEYALPRDAEADGLGDALPLVMPRLRRVQVRDFAKDVAALLSRLSLPSMVDLDIKSPSDPVSTDDLLRLAGIVNRYLRSVDERYALRALQIFIAETRVTFWVWSNAEMDGRPRLHLTGRIADDQRERALRTLLEPRWSSSVETLMVLGQATDPSIDDAYWQELLSASLNVRTVWALGETCKAFVSALAAASGSGEAPGGLSLPALEKLVVQEFYGDEQWVKTIQHAVHQRAQNNVPLHELCLVASQDHDEEEEEVEEAGPASSSRRFEGVDLVTSADEGEIMAAAFSRSDAVDEY